MNAKQRSAVQVGIAVAVLMGIFPPWTDSFRFEQVISQGAAGYSFILDPPKAEYFHTITIDLSRLLVQWVVVALAVACGFLSLREPSKQ
jgi:hypothetical protein